MSVRRMHGLALAFLVFATGVARARHGGGGHMAHGGGHPHHGPGGAQLAAVAGGYAAFGFGWPYFVAGPGYYAPYYPIAMTMGPAGYFYPVGAVPPPMPMRGPLLPPMPPPAAVERAQPARPAGDAARAAHLITFGDRLFRAGNLKRAEERYLQARKAAPNQAAPQLRLAVIAVARGRYAEAADRFRDAETAEPGWLLNAADIQSIYGEPTEFLRELARLESFVQSHPDDRSAWLVLGGFWFLSGRTARAADVFLRLDDPHRRPDVALAAFLFASDHARARAEQGDSQATKGERPTPDDARPVPPGR